MDEKILDDILAQAPSTARAINESGHAASIKMMLMSAYLRGMRAGFLEAMGEASMVTHENA